MVFCKYFMQGTCKFGSSCKFEHDRGGQWAGSQNYTSPLSLGAAKPAQGSTSNVDTSALVKSVVTDMTSAEKGGQWIISCYAPFKEKDAFPGFEDYSFEEDRYAYYEARKTGMLDQYKQQWNSILQQASLKVRTLQNPTQEIAAVLRKIYDASPKMPIVNSAFVGNQNVFGSSEPSNLFASNSANTSFTQQQTLSPLVPSNQSLFGKSQQQQQTAFKSPLFPSSQNQNIFGPKTNSDQAAVSNSTSIFGNQQSSAFNTNFFGNQNPSTTSYKQTSGNQFGMQQNTSLFGNPQNLFGGQQQNQMTTSNPQSTPLFVGQQNQIASQNLQSNSVFGSQQNQLQNPQNSLLFSGQQTQMTPQNTQSNSLFGNQQSPTSSQNSQSSSLFGSQQTTQVAAPSLQSNPVFGGQQNGSIFRSSQVSMQNPQNNSFFGGQNQITSQSSQSNSVFRAQQNQVSSQTSQSSSVFGGQQTQTPHNFQGNSIFGGQSQALPQNSVFGGQQSVASQQSTFFGVNSNSVNNSEVLVDEKTYSKPEDLTEAEIKWFQSDSLDIENIPLKPPTMDMCFR